MERATTPFCCRYYHDGAWWALTIHAYDWNDARVRCRKLGLNLDGELKMEFKLFGYRIAWAITTWNNFFILQKRMSASATVVDCCKASYRVPISERFVVGLRNLWHCRTAWAVKHLSRELQRSPGFRESWQANIAMPIYDATRPKCSCAALHFCGNDRMYELHSPGCQIHQAETAPRRFECREMSIEQANYIADKLLKHLFDA